MWLKNSNLGTGLSRHAWPNQRQHVQPIRIWLCNSPANPCYPSASNGSISRGIVFVTKIPPLNHSKLQSFAQSLLLYKMWKTTKPKTKMMNHSSNWSWRKFQNVPQRPKLLVYSDNIHLPTSLRKPKKTTCWHQTPPGSKSPSSFFNFPKGPANTCNVFGACMDHGGGGGSGGVGEEGELSSRCLKWSAIFHELMWMWRVFTPMCG